MTGTVGIVGAGPRVLMGPFAVLAPAISGAVSALNSLLPKRSSTR